MTNRREFLGAAGALAFGLTTGMPAQAAKPSAPPRWKPFRKAYAIDGLSGPDLFYLTQDDPAYAESLKALRECGMTGLMTTAGPQGRFWYSNQQFEETKQRMTDWTAKIDAHPDVLMLVRERADFDKAKRDGKVGIIFTFQGAEPLGEDLDRITLFRNLGLRVLQLTHNRRNLVGDGCMEPGNAGLSNLGHQVVERANAEKIVVDLAHGAPRTIREGILASKKPVLIGHSGCRSLVDVPRLVYDAELKLLADRGGVVGIIFWPYIRRQGQQTSEDVIRHIEHAIDVCGEDHVGIGTDLSSTPLKMTPEYAKENAEFIKGMIEDGIFEKDRDPNLYLFPPDLNVANRFEVLAAKLSARGFKDARIEKILGGNFARVMGDVWG